MDLYRGDRSATLNAKATGDIRQLARRAHFHDKTPKEARRAPFAPDVGLERDVGEEPHDTLGPADHAELAAGLRGMGVELRPGDAARLAKVSGERSALHQLVRTHRFTGTGATPTEGPVSDRPNIGSNRPRRAQDKEWVGKNREEAERHRDPNAMGQIIAHHRAGTGADGRRRRVTARGVGGSGSAAKGRRLRMAQYDDGTGDAGGGADDNMSVVSTASSVAVSVTGALQSSRTKQSRDTVAAGMTYWRDPDLDSVSSGGSKRRRPPPPPRPQQSMSVYEQLMVKRRDWRGVFLKFERDIDGTVSTATLRKGLVEQTHSVSRKQLDAFIQAADPKGTGQVSFHAFAKAMEGAVPKYASVPGPMSERPKARSKGDHTHNPDDHAWVPTRKGEVGKHRRKGARSPGSVSVGGSTTSGGGGGGDGDADRPPIPVAGAPSGVGPGKRHKVRAPGRASPQVLEAPGPDGGRKQTAVTITTGTRVPADHDVVLPASIKRARRLRHAIQNRMGELFGSTPGRARKMFLKFPRASDGVTSAQAIAKALRQAGVRGVSARDVVDLVTMARRVPGHGDLPMNSARVSYDEWATAVDKLDHDIEKVSEKAPMRSRTDSAGGASGGSGVGGGGGRVAWADDASSEVLSVRVGSEGAVVDMTPAERDTCMRVTSVLQTRGEKPSKLFLTADSDRNNTCTNDELFTGLSYMGVALSQGDQTRLTNVLDPDGTGFVSYNTVRSVLFPPDHDPLTARMQPDGLAEHASHRRHVRSPRRATIPSLAFQDKLSGEVHGEGGGDGDSVASGATGPMSADDLSDAAGKLKREDARYVSIGRGGDGVMPEEKALAMSDSLTRGLRAGGGGGDGGAAGDYDPQGLKVSTTSRKHYEQTHKDAHTVAYVPVDIYGAALDAVPKRRHLTNVPGHDHLVGETADARAEHLIDRRLVQHVMSRLTLRAKNARELFLTLDHNKDGRLSHTELKSGLAAIGLHVGDGEECLLNDHQFDVVARTLSGPDGDVTFQTFARGLRMDDPLPADPAERQRYENEMRQRSLQSEHRPIHVYRPPVDAPTAPGQGVPRHTYDSRVMYESILSSGGDLATEASADTPDAALSESVAQAHLADKLVAKRGDLRALFLKLNPDASGRLPVSQLRSSLAKVGITASQKQVEAFVAPLVRAAEERGASAGEARAESVMDYSTFRTLAQARAPRARSEHSTASSGLVHAPTSAEGLGHFGIPFDYAAAAGESGGGGGGGGDSDGASTTSMGLRVAHAGRTPGSRGVAFALHLPASAASDAGDDPAANDEYNHLPSAGAQSVPVQRRKMIRPPTRSLNGENVSALLHVDAPAANGAAGSADDGGAGAVRFTADHTPAHGGMEELDPAHPSHRRHVDARRRATVATVPFADKLTGESHDLSTPAAARGRAGGDAGAAGKAATLSLEHGHTHRDSNRTHGPDIDSVAHRMSFWDHSSASVRRDAAHALAHAHTPTPRRGASGGSGAGSETGARAASPSKVVHMKSTPMDISSLAASAASSAAESVTSTGRSGRMWSGRGSGAWGTSSIASDAGSSIGGGGGGGGERVAGASTREMATGPPKQRKMFGAAAAHAGIFADPQYPGATP